MYAHVTMTFLKSVVFSDIMKVISTNYDGPLHFHFLDDTGENASSDRHVASKRTFLIDVGSLNGLRTNVTQCFFF